MLQNVHYVVLFKRGAIPYSCHRDYCNQCVSPAVYVSYKLPDLIWGHSEPCIIFCSDDQEYESALKALSGNEKARKQIMDRVVLVMYQDHLDEEDRQRQRKEQEVPTVRGVISGYIYLYRVGDKYKIGRAKNIADRKKKYITENPDEIEILKEVLVEDYVSAEKQLLSLFPEKRHRGEWFAFSESEAEEIINQMSSFSI